MSVRRGNPIPPAVHASGDRTVSCSRWAHAGDNVVVLVFGKAVHQQALVLGQFPQLQGACRRPGPHQLPPFSLSNRTCTVFKGSLSTLCDGSAAQCHNVPHKAWVKHILQ